MEGLALGIFGILGAVVAAPTTWLLHWLKLLPAGVSARLAGAILWSVFTGGAFLANYVEQLVVRPWRTQAAHLGAQYGTPFNLRRYSASGFQDVLLETSYQLSPAQAAKLRLRCGRPTRAFGLSGCALYSWHGGKYDEEALVILLSSDGQLHIVELA